MAEIRIGAATAATENYGKVARLLHWAVAGAVVLQFVLANLADDTDSRFREFVLLANHKSVGVTILVVALLRLGWRFAVPPPAPVAMPGWQRTASALSHSALYALIILMPITGWLMSSASNVPVSWFNLFQLPDFIAPDERLAGLFEDTHETMAKFLFVLAIIHVAAAVKHALIDRDVVLKRISSPAALVLFVAIIVAGLFALIPASRAEGGESGEWRIDYDDSYIRFEAMQAGARFEGVFTDWQARIRFDAARPGNGKFDVEVRIAGVATGDEERDRTLAEPEFFDAGDHPVATWRSSDVSTENRGFVATGELRIKGETYPAPLVFDVQVDDDRRVLTGSARLDRLELGVGTGEWSDTAWIGRYVDVRVRVVASID